MAGEESATAKLPPRPSAPVPGTNIQNGIATASEMAPSTSNHYYRRIVPKDRFSSQFSTLKTQTYHDPNARGGGISHSIRTITWNPTGSMIATGSADKTLRIWNPDRASARYSTDLKGHTMAIERVAFNPTKESELSSVSSDGTIKFWDVRTKHCISTIQLGDQGFTLAWSADGETIVVGRKDDVLIPISRSTLTKLAEYPQPLQTNQLAFPYAAPPETLLLTHGDGTVKILSYPDFQPLHTLQAHTSACLSLELSPTGRYLAIGGSDALITLWDTTDWVCKRSLDRIVGSVKSLGFSFDGSYILGGSDEGTGLEIAHVETGEYVHTIPTNHPAPVVAWHPHRYWVAHSGDPGGLKIVGAAGGNM
ncbi:MAG: hypothetical protein M1834_001799 [Cirrosporium novae-zelandiae]|nr:MAG: hypothetical protein M1834_001799 [Cirrosporium novae-zelandiae]